MKECKDIDLDREWIELLLEAKKLGLTIEDIRLFLGTKGQVHCPYINIVND
ncbi:anti-repressor SinI family protein [Heyndrickxia sp. NPDC080065]|uniref:anti-repressor SinI family protein n=1 Tax=Heyndrickxia sp. NPDC080065 TaxID=3390568 RepID=UPI003D06B901